MVTNSDLSNGLHCLVFKHMVSEVSGLLSSGTFFTLSPHSSFFVARLHVYCLGMQQIKQYVQNELC